jgi:8-oxo-dGTP diphosphatase
LVPVTAAIIRDDCGRVLLAQRSERGRHSLKWEFPGGKLRDDESPEACLCRELEEELGVRVEVGEIFHVVHHQYDEFSVLLMAYNCRLKDREIQLVEHKAYAWVEPVRLLSFDLAAADRPIAEKFLQSGANDD